MKNNRSRLFRPHKYKGLGWMLTPKTMTRKTIAKGIFSLLSLIFSLNVFAEDQDINDILDASLARDETSYVSFGGALNEIGSIEIFLTEVSFDRDGDRSEDVIFADFPLTAQTYGVYAAAGTYITETFKTEFRLGTGVRSDTVLEALELNLNYWFSWYIGATKRITDYMSGYVLYGVTIYDADVTRYEREFLNTRPRLPETVIVQPSIERMEKGFFGNNFSTSWMLGLDFDITEDWFLAFEYGRLLKDDESGADVYQAGVQLRYEY